jgi:hypothetical protein
VEFVRILFFEYYNGTSTDAIMPARPFCIAHGPRCGKFSIETKMTGGWPDNVDGPGGGEEKKSPMDKLIFRAAVLFCLLSSSSLLFCLVALNPCKLL